jgi:putative oxidoreductase
MQMTKELGLLPVRGALGATMLYHGAQKLRAEAAPAHAQFFEQIGFKPGGTWAKAAGVAEVFAGASVLLGLATRLAGVAILATQALAISRVHGEKGFENMKGGYEFNLLLAAAGVGLLVSGPGVFSVHEVIERGLQRGRWLRPRRGAAIGAVKLLK